MKAIRVHEFGGPEEMRLEDVPDLQPGPGHVLVRIKAAGVNPVDTYIRSGNYGNLATPPYTPGMDGAGTIESIGEGVENVARGDRVYVAGTLSGSYAEAALCRAANVHPLPDDFSFAQGAAINVPYATAHRALFGRARARSGETVLVHGATGGVGLAATQIAKAAGLTVIGTGGTESGRQLVLEQGAQHVLDHRAPDYLDQVMQLTNGRGVDVILEMLANVNLGKDLSLLARSGRVVVIGSRGTVEIDPRQTMSRDASILGMTLMNATPEEAAAIHQALGEGFRDGSLRPIIAREFPLAEAPRAHEAVMQPGAHGKIVLVV